MLAVLPTLSTFAAPRYATPTPDRSRVSGNSPGNQVMLIEQTQRQRMHACRHSSAALAQQAQQHWHSRHNSAGQAQQPQQGWHSSHSTAGQAQQGWHSTAGQAQQAQRSRHSRAGTAATSHNQCDVADAAGTAGTAHNRCDAAGGASRARGSNHPQQHQRCASAARLQAAHAGTALTATTQLTQHAGPH